MTTALALDLGFDRPSILGGSRDEPGDPHGRAPHDRGHTPHEHHASHDRLTLDDLVTGVWEGLSSHHTVTCPVCSGKMAPRYGSGARPVGGCCQRCGSTLG
jgi:DnaJ-class molecular chaperone